MYGVRPEASRSRRGPPDGRPRREAIVSLVPNLWPVVEVGCDQGWIASALGAIGTERHRHRLPERRRIRLVVADGLSCFSRVGVAVISGMGAATISRILQVGPACEAAVLHATDRPDRLRLWCASHGWRIDAERLAPEAGRFAEVMRVVPGTEPHQGLDLAFGPLLGKDPLVRAHAERLLARWRTLRDGPGRRAVEARASRWIAFLETLLVTLPARPPTDQASTR